MKKIRTYEKKTLKVGLEWPDTKNEGKDLTQDYITKVVDTAMALGIAKHLLIM